MHDPVHSRLVWPAVAPYRPAAQRDGVEVPDEHAKPKGQTSHCEAALRLLASVYVPGAQAMAVGVPS
eukprot:3673608-Prymnesium_polylepis.1